MAYHIYTTRGIVLDKRTRRDNDMVYTIFTRELGLVRALGIGVRKEKSKLRAGLEPYSISTVSMVRGKGEWRITGVYLEQSLATSALRSKSLLVYTRVFSLVRSLIQGEDAMPHLYDKLERDLLSLSLEKDESRQKALEAYLVSHLVYELGYLTEEDLPQSVNETEERFEDVIRSINMGLSESGLITA